MSIIKITTISLLTVTLILGAYSFDTSSNIIKNKITYGAEIDKYPRPIKKQQVNYHWKNNCTWYVHNKRNKIKRYLPSHFTHAKNWLNEAKKAGFSTGKKPVVGSILQTRHGGGGYGHVAYVEKVYKNGSILISEYNYNIRLGYGTRTLTKAQASKFNYIY